MGQISGAVGAVFEGCLRTCQRPRPLSRREHSSRTRSRREHRRAKLCRAHAVHSSLRGGRHKAHDRPARYRSSHWVSLRIAARGRTAPSSPGGQNAGFSGLSANARSAPNGAFSTTKTAYRGLTVVLWQRDTKIDCDRDFPNLFDLSDTSAVAAW